ncbi:hypothetical protein [Paenibacillus sp. FSL R7-0179]|uniref:hypothetical protein n=1 Tax=Paenibacillus sp. FSL R7-0179 TaxID=2921672 RepID=UPI0030F6FF7B
MYTYVVNNPLIYSDPTGHIMTRGADSIGSDGGSSGDGLEFKHFSDMNQFELTQIMGDGRYSMDVRGAAASEFVKRNFLLVENGAIKVASNVKALISSAKKALKVERVVNDLGKSEKFALGLRDYLDDFAAGQGAKTWKHFDQDWKVTVLERLNNANVKIEFNLTGIDSPWASVSRAARGAGGATDWELLQIKSNPQVWGRITWYENGKKVPNPFE